MLLAGCLLVTVISSGFSNEGWTEEPSKLLTVSVWGGGHSTTLQHSVLTPFAELTRTKVTAQHRRATEIESELATSDVVELELHEAINACDNGELSLLPGYDVVDFVPNALQPCSVGQYVWSTIFAYDGSAYKSGNQPTLITDFFNIRHYPGRRAIRKSPRVIAEWALLAAGIPAAEIYQTLAQSERAWQIIESVLHPISQSIVWVDDDDQAIEMLRTGAVTFAMVGNDTLVRAVAAGADNLQPVWDGSVNQMSLWAIPVTADNPALAWQFVRYATSEETARRFSAMSGYGPSRYSSLEQISRNYHPYLPSNRSNLGNIVWGNSSWWREHGELLDLRFINWLSSQFVKSDS